MDNQNLYYKIEFGKYKSYNIKHLFKINDKKYIKWCLDTFKDKKTEREMKFYNALKNVCDEYELYDLNF